MKTNTIHCGECAKTMRRHIPDNSVDLTVTSPPYDDLREYNGYTFEFEPIAAELWRVTKPGGAVVWVVADATVKGSETGTSFKQALGFIGLGFRLHDTMIYEAKKAPLTHNRYEQSFEYMFVFSKGRLKTFNGIEINRTYSDNRTRSFFRREKDGSKDSGFRGKKPKVLKYNVWRYVPNGGNSTKDKYAHQHPAIFPEALARDHIISWSNPGDIVLDPMCGSGTTLKMAVEQGREYIGIDISQEYVSLAEKRVSGARVPLPGFGDVVKDEKVRPIFNQLELVRQ